MEEKSWVVEVDGDAASKLLEIKEAEKKDWEKHSIYKLPACVTKLNPEAYKPRAISFGPYHYDDPDLKPMEPHKDRVLFRFLNRLEMSMQLCIEKMNGVAQELMDAYDSLDPKWEKDSASGFMEMMIRDGCFMLELLRYNADPRSDEYAENDPIFSNHGIHYMIPYIMRDMLMLENQLPMLVLIKLLSLEDQEAKLASSIQRDKDEYINGLIVKLCFSDDRKNIRERSRHVLDVYRKVLISKGKCKQCCCSIRGFSVCCCCSTDKEQEQEHIPNNNNPDNEHDIIPSATELGEAGIKIKKCDSKDIVNGITFKTAVFCATLWLPKIVVDDTTGPVYLNLIAFERFHVGIGNEVTSYVAFMDDIIDNEKDVNDLKSRGIIENAYGSAMAVADLFNSLSKDTTLDPKSRLTNVRIDAKNYSRRKWNRFRGILMRTYFTNPWAAMALIAAIFAFGLTIIQTLYTMGQYYQQANSKRH